MGQDGFLLLSNIYKDKLSNLGSFSLRLDFFFIKIWENTMYTLFGMGPFMGPGYIGRKIPLECERIRWMDELAFFCPGIPYLF